MTAPVVRSLAVGVSVALAATGCFQSGYIAQAGYGQDEIAYLARPIDEVVEQSGVPERTRALLRLVKDVKRYGEGRGLEPTNSYRHFVDLGRSQVVMVVSASHPLRFDLVTWTFPIVGSVPYLGWFNARDAESFANGLRAQGLDVDVRGASAYSTLGWFDDPVLSTMIRNSDTVVGDLVNVVLHESVHATHYVNGQTNFNESLADFVADQLTPHYLQKRLKLDRWQLFAYREAQIRGEERALRFHQAYLDLERLYASRLPPLDKLIEKQRILTKLQRDLDFWRPINNATLAQARAYHGGVPAFAQLLDCVGGRWSEFWARIRRIDELSFTKPQQDDIAPALRPHLTRCRDKR
jgi:predicted aminopeptidase